MGAALLYGFVSWALQLSASFKTLAYTHAIEAVLLLTIAICLLLDGEVLFATLAAEAALLHLVGMRLNAKSIVYSAHLFFGVMAIWLMGRLPVPEADGPAVLNAQALADLWLIILGVAVAALFKSSVERDLYRVTAHIAVLAWVLRELYQLPNGHGYVTIIWGVYAVVLLVAGLRTGRRVLRKAAIATLIAVVVKLFIVDLAHLKAMWRILLFLGFGGLFLVISYYFRQLWHQGQSASNDE